MKMSKIIECKKCGGLINTLYQDKGLIQCRWCGHSFDRKHSKVIKKIKIPGRVLTILEKYFDKNQIDIILK